MLFSEVEAEQVHREHDTMLISGRTLQTAEQRDSPPNIYVVGLHFGHLASNVSLTLAGLTNITERCFLFCVGSSSHHTL